MMRYGAFVRTVTPADVQISARVHRTAGSPANRGPTKSVESRGGEEGRRSSSGPPGPEGGVPSRPARGTGRSTGRESRPVVGAPANRESSERPWSWFGTALAPSRGSITRRPRSPRLPIAVDISPVASLVSGDGGRERSVTGRDSPMRLGGGQPAHDRLS